MAYEQKDNSGVLFRNAKKEKESQPDYNGNALIDGREYWISAWVKISEKGNKFFSFAFKPKEEQTISQRAVAGIKKPDPISSGLDMNDEIPF